MYDKLERRSPESESISDPVLEISQIGEVHKFLRIDKEHKSRGLDAHLCRIPDLEHMSLVTGRLLHHACFINDLIENARLYAHVLVGADEIDLIVQLDQALSGLRRDEEYLRVR